MKKIYDQELSNKYDTPARAAAKELFKDSDWIITEGELYGVDLVIYEGDNKIAYIETEVKTNWNRDRFQYWDVQWPERKQKYCSLDKPTIFLMFNHNLSRYLTATGDILLSSEIKVVSNKYVEKGEKFFKVPVEKVIFNDIKRQLWELTSK